MSLSIRHIVRAGAGFGLDRRKLLGFAAAGVLAAAFVPTAAVT